MKVLFQVQNDDVANSLFGQNEEFCMYFDT
jgi:hypothetical protein